MWLIKGAVQWNKLVTETLQLIFGIRSTKRNLPTSWKHDMHCFYRLLVKLKKTQC